MEKPAIVVENVYKEFRIPHEKHSSLKATVLNLFKKKNYSTFKAAEGISFEVKKGEFFGVIGKNGSGKSTLLKMLAGIYTPTKGKISINGKLSPFLELGVGFNPELTARENVYLGGSILGLTRNEIDEKFDEIIGFAELEDFVDMKFKNFSSGMQVRLAFALSINAHAEILLMDEVLAVGDTNFQTKCINEFIKYRQQGKTVVLVTHDLGKVQSFCDRALFLRDGKVVALGPALEVADEYIEQNIVDSNVAEQKASKEEESVEEEKGENFKKVEIKKLLFTDSKGNAKTTFETGESITFEIHTKKRKEIKELNVGIGLYTSTDGYIFGYNTKFDNYKVNFKSDVIKIVFPKMPLLSGEYYVNVVCFGDIESDYYDVKPKFKNIKIMSKGKKNKYRGSIDIEHEWSS